MHRYIINTEGEHLRVTNKNIRRLCEELIDSEKKYTIEYSGMTAKQLLILDQYKELYVEWPNVRQRYGRIFFDGTIFWR